jgi:hypothetical protein
MGNVIWKGNAPAVAQVQDYLFAGTWEADDVVTLTIGSKTVSVVTGSTVIATLVDAVVSAWNALTSTVYPEFAEITASRSTSTLRLTADTAGKPFTCTVATVDAGGAADAQTIDGGTTSTGTATVASSGPYDWSTAANWSAGAVPVNSDDVWLENTAVSILYGLSQSGVLLTSLNIASSFTGTIGLPDYTGTYAEYRARKLAVGATTINVGYGEGPGSSRLRLDPGAHTTTINVYGTGNPSDFVNPTTALEIKGSGSNYTLNLTRGYVSVATETGDTATLTVVKGASDGTGQGGATLTLGPGCTTTTVTWGAGKLHAYASITTLNLKGGEAWAYRSATITTLIADAGTYHHQSGGTVTNLTVGSEARVDFSRDLRAKTITTCVVYAGARLDDPAGTVTFSGGIVLTRCKLSEVFIDVGDNRTITPS